jgi:hypothetical protein
MNTHPGPRNQRGALLVVSMLFLLVVTIISVVAARNSSFGTKMASNMQDSYASFQSAEAGILATLLLSRTAGFDPFQRADNATPFAGIDAGDHPLRALNDGTANMDVQVWLTATDLACPRSMEASSVGEQECDYYRIESEHDAPQRARTKVDLGTVKTLIGTGN